MFLQELEGVAPTTLGGGRPKQESKNIEESVLNVDLVKRFRQEGGSLFSQAFVEDSILIFRQLKKVTREREKKRQFSIKPLSLQNLAGTTGTDDPASGSGQGVGGSTNAEKRVNNITFLNKGGSPGTNAGQKVSSVASMESPRNERYKPRNEYDELDKDI